MPTMTHPLSRAAALLLAVAGPASAQSLDFERSSEFGNQNFGAGYAFSLGFDADDTSAEALGAGNVYANIFGRRADIVDASTSASYGDGGAEAGASLDVLGEALQTYELSTDGVAVNLDEFSKTFVEISTTITVGPIPVHLAADVTGTVGIDGEASFGGGTIEAVLTPYARLEGSASAGVGIACAHAGVQGTVSLVDASAPLGAAIDFAEQEITLVGEAIVSTLAGTIDLVASWCIGSASLNLLSWPAAAELVVPIIDYTYAYGQNPRANCPVGDYDGNDCEVGTALGGTTPFIAEGKLLTTPQTYASCRAGRLVDGRCYVASAPPSTSPTIRNRNEMWSTKDRCSMGVFDGSNCKITAPEGTHGFIYYGGLYVTPSAGNVCVIGGHDGANCYLGHPPQGTSAYVYGGDLYLSTLPTPVCREGREDPTGCYLGQMQVMPHDQPYTLGQHFYLTPDYTRVCPTGTLTTVGGQPACHLADIPPDLTGWIRDGRDLMTTSLYGRSVTALSTHFAGVYNSGVSLDASAGWSDSDVYVRRLGDVDGDGNADVVGFGTAETFVFLADGQGGFDRAPGFEFAQEFTTATGWGAEYPRALADINGDGRDDIVGFGHAQVWVKLSTGQGFGPAQGWSGDCTTGNGWNSTHVRMLGDVDGNGMDDIVCISDDTVWVGYSDGQRFGPLQVATYQFTAPGGWSVAQYPRVMGDVDGDGRDDLVGFGWGEVFVGLSNGAGFDLPVASSPGMTYDRGWRVDQHPRMVADADGDGRVDLVGFGDSDIMVAHSNGDGTFTAGTSWLPHLGYSEGWRVERHFRGLGDIDGDGDADIVAFGEDSGGDIVSLSVMPGE